MEKLRANATPPDLPLTKGHLSSPDTRPGDHDAQIRYAMLSGIPSTLRITLAARAHGDILYPQVAVCDARAAATLAALGDDGRQWLRVRDRPEIYGVLARTRRFRELASAFLRDHPGGRVFNIGCGLCDYFQWLDDGQASITDADLPEVMSIRRQLLPAKNDRQQLREVDLTAPDWWDKLDVPVNRDAPPLFLFTEGVLNYLTPEVVNSVLRTFGERAPTGSFFAFDALCWLAAGRARYHPSVRRTTAEFHWGPRKPADLVKTHSRLRLVATYDVSESSGLPHSLIGRIFRKCVGVPIYAIYMLQAL
jgi:O-methyltransferase involved in polyketide biosynthesis